MKLFDASKKAVAETGQEAQALAKPRWVQREADELTDAVFNGKLLPQIDFLSHHEERHTKQPITDMIERCISKDMRQRVSAASEFNDKETMQAELEDAILDNAEEIVKWRANPNGEYTKAFLSEPKDEPVGHGVRFRLGNLEHAETSQTAVVLSIDRKNPHGFRLTTLYPYINTDTAQTTGKDITQELHEAPSYKDAAPERKQMLDRAAAIETQPSERKTPNAPITKSTRQDRTYE